uniref:Uncharacterized protein n=1 Tax=Glossina pallidipes TaxID=7398 RepID=A0A1A9ZKY1_GLOPL
MEIMDGISTQHAQNTSSAGNKELLVLDDVDHNANAFLEDLLQDIPEIAATYHGIKAESTENSATNRVRDEMIFATTATQTDAPNIKDAVVQTMQTKPFAKLSSINFDLNCNQSRGFRELGQLLLDPSLSLSMKSYCLQKICKTHYLGQPDLRTATNCIPYMPLMPDHGFNSNNFHYSIFQIMQDIFGGNNQAQMLSFSGNRCRVKTTPNRQIYRGNFCRGRRKHK